MKIKIGGVTFATGKAASALAKKQRGGKLFKWPWVK